MFTLVDGQFPFDMEDVKVMSDTELLGVCRLVFADFPQNVSSDHISMLRRDIFSSLPSSAPKVCDLASLGIDLNVGNLPISYFSYSPLPYTVLGDVEPGMITDKSICPRGDICISNMSGIIDGLLQGKCRSMIDTVRDIFGCISVPWLLCVLDEDDWKKRLTTVANGVGLNLKISHHTLIIVLWYTGYLPLFKQGKEKTELHCRKQTPASMLESMKKDGYIGAEDDASVIIAYLSGRYISHMTINNDLIRKNPFGVVLGFLSLAAREIHPYSVQSTSRAYKFCLSITGFDHLAKSMKDIGMVPGRDINPLTYFIKSIDSYEDLLGRSTNLCDDIPINMYTDREIISIYEPKTNRYRSRDNLIWKVTVGAGVGWSFRKNKPSNLTSISAGGESYIDEFRASTGDIIVSYGTSLKYRCWSVSCLLDFLGVEMDVDGVPIKGFFVPDYLPPSRRGKDYPDDTLSDSPMFTEQQTIDLCDLLSDLPERVRVGSVALLISRLKSELIVFKEKSKSAISWLQLHMKLDNTRKEMFMWYVYWLLTLSIWTRKWKGPGHPYPHNWVADGELSKILCTPEERDSNVIAHMVPCVILRNILRTHTTCEPFADMDAFRKMVPSMELMETYSWNPIHGEVLHNPVQNTLLINLMESLHLVNFNFESGNYAVNVCEKSRIDYILKSYLDGKECAAQMGDILTQSSVFFAQKILGHCITGIPQKEREFIIRLYPHTANPNNTAPYTFTQAVMSGHVLRIFREEQTVRQDPKAIKRRADQINMYYGEPNYWLS
jgi:hypothetical protein